MADYDPMNPVHAGPKSPKIKATIRGGGSYSRPTPQEPVEGSERRRLSMDDIERMKQTFVAPHLFEASRGRIRTEFDLYTYQAGGGLAALPNYPTIKDSEYRLIAPNSDDLVGYALAKADLRARRGEFKKDPETPPPPPPPKNNNKPVKKAPVKKAVVMVKKPRPKSD